MANNVSTTYIDMLLAMICTYVHICMYVKKIQHNVYAYVLVLIHIYSHDTECKWNGSLLNFVAKELLERYYFGASVFSWSTVSIRLPIYVPQ